MSIRIATKSFGKSKICNFSLKVVVQENIAGLNIPMNYWRVATFVQIMQAYGKINAKKLIHDEHLEDLL